MDDFPVIVPEDDGFAIYLNDERVDWYNNEADAEGVALSMVDEELNSESFFDRPLEESVSDESDLQSEIVNIINATNDFKAKVDGQYIKIFYHKEYDDDYTKELADFYLDKGIKHDYYPGTLNSRSNGDGKNTFRIVDVSDKWGSLSFKSFYNDEEQFLPKYLTTLVKLCRYYTLKTLYDNEFLYDHPVPEEATNWHCAQWGTWKFIINSLDDVKTCIAALEDGFDMAQEKYSTLYESANLKEDTRNFGHKIYTGLPYKEEYQSIISSFVGQIWDGIGEGDGREGRIFNYYYQRVDYVHADEENGELIVYVWADDIDQLVRGIWRVAQIERSDEGATDKNMYYDYLDANWSDICKLQGALTAISKKWKQNHDDPSMLTQPWSAEKKAASDARIAKAKADAEAKAAAEKKAKEEAEAAEKARFDQKQADIATNIHPDAKDVMRAEDAWKRTFNKLPRLQNLYYQMELQLDKITDLDKAKRRLVAFYQEALKHSDEDSYDYWIKRFKEKMDRDIDL